MKESFPGELTTIARMGSGSACRSLYGGFVRWEAGVRPDGTDSIGIQVAPASHWPDLEVIIMVVSAHKKDTSSTDGMVTSVLTSDLLKVGAPLADHSLPLSFCYCVHQLVQVFLASTWEGGGVTAVPCSPVVPFWCTRESVVVCGVRSSIARLLWSLGGWLRLSERTWTRISTPLGESPCRTAISSTHAVRTRECSRPPLPFELFRFGASHFNCFVIFAQSCPLRVSVCLAVILPFST